MPLADEPQKGVTASAKSKRVSRRNAADVKNKA